MNFSKITGTGSYIPTIKKRNSDFLDTHFLNPDGSDFSNGNEGDYVSNTYNNPSYFDILVEANKSVIHTGDYQHTFLEGINQIVNEDVYDYVGIKPKDNYKYYEFILGS